MATNCCDQSTLARQVCGFIWLLLKGVPRPGVVEGFDLGRGGLAALILDEDVVGAVGVEGRVEVDQIHRLVRDVLTKHPQVVAVVEGVGPHVPAFRMRSDVRIVGAK